MMIKRDGPRAINLSPGGGPMQRKARQMLEGDDFFFAAF